VTDKTRIMQYAAVWRRFIEFKPGDTSEERIALGETILRLEDEMSQPDRMIAFEMASITTARPQ